MPWNQWNHCNRCDKPSDKRKNESNIEGWDSLASGRSLCPECYEIVEKEFVALNLKSEENE